MKFIDTLRENTRVSSVWLCRAKSTHLTKTGKEYESITLQDKTGSVDGKIWDPGNPGIGDFDAPDYVAVDADVQLFNGSLQLNIRRIRKADESEYIPADYLPTSDKDNDVMFSELLEEIAGVKDPYLSRLLESFLRTRPLSGNSGRVPRRRACTTASWADSWSTPSAWRSSANITARLTRR